MKKVVFIVDSFPSYSETFLYNQIYYLLDQGYQVEILSIKSKDRFAKSIHQKMYEYDLWGKCSFLRYNFDFGIFKNLLFHPILSLSFLKISNIKRGIFLIRNLDLLLAYSKYDVIHAHYGHVAALVCDLKSIGLYRNVRIVCSFHGEDVSHNLPNTHSKKYYNIGRLADVVTVNSIYTYNCLLKSVGETWNNIKVIPVPFDSNYFKPSSITEEPKELFELVFCGRLIEWKAPILAIQIILELIELNYSVNLNIIGDGPEYQECEAFISKNGLANYVKLLGALSQEEILLKFDEADVFLFPCIRESTTLKTEAQGLVLQEAQAMRLPVVISNVGGMKYGMRDGVTGFIVEENDVDGFVKKVIELIENPGLRKKMGVAARDFVLSNFDVEVIGTKMLKLYGFR